MREEQVLCVARQEWEQIAGQFVEFLPGHEWLLNVFRYHGCFYARSEVEDKEDWLQLIPYTVIESAGRFLLYQRGSGSGESRLLGKMSIGVGGHIQTPLHTPVSVPTWQKFVMHEARREIQEELLLGDLAHYTHLGWIQTRDEDVDRVHLGIVGVWEAEGFSVSPNSGEVENPVWATFGDLERAYGQLEGWSQVMMLNLPRVYTLGRNRFDL